MLIGKMEVNMQELWIKNLKEVLGNHERRMERQIIIWGASPKSDRIFSVLENWGLPIAGYIDKNFSNVSEYNGYPVYPIEKLVESKYFVFVALKAHYDEVISQLDEMEYIEFVDFWYPERIIALDGTKNYQDLYGNRLVTENICPMNVQLRSGGVIEIKTKELGGETTVASAGKSFVKIGERVKFGKDVTISSTNGSILIDHDCKFDSFIKVRCSCGGSVHIESNCTMQRQCTLVASFDAKITLGKDCMVSYSVFMRAGNSHNMIDLNSMEHLDDNAERDVICGEHVWVGMRATLLNGVEIGAGSTIGANSFVCKKKFPPNCCLAGIPAKIIRERTAWIRDGISIHKDIEDYQEFIYDEQY